MLRAAFDDDTVPRAQRQPSRRYLFAEDLTSAPIPISEKFAFR